MKNELNIKSGGPTYYHTTGASELDFYLVSRDLIGDVKCASFPNSDHEGVIMSIKSTNAQRKNDKCRITFRSKIKDEETFKSDMLCAMLYCIETSNERDVEEQAKVLVETFRAILNYHAPMKNKLVSRQKLKSNLTDATLKLMKSRNKARNLWVTASPQERKLRHEAFKRLRNKVNSAIKRDRIEKAEHDLQQGMNAFEVADKILGKCKERQKISLLEEDTAITDDKHIASVFNEFFIEKIRKLKQKIDPNLVQDPLLKMRRLCSSFSFNLVSIEHVERIIRSMKTSPSCGIDGISSKVLKIVTKEVAPALSQLVNSSFESGIFPECFKQAKITPIFKNKGSAKEKNNYRPVSGLSTLGKVLEIAANIQITRYGERTGILGKHQHGFRRGRSTTSALISSVIKWQTTREEKRHTGCLLYDLSAAYDTISPEILVRKAEKYGFDNTSCSWLRSFTTERSQSVTIGQSVSDMRKLPCGIPQGSPLSCTLFLMYVQDITEWITEGELQGYADDTLHFISSTDADKVITRLEKQARNIFTYFASNELVANPAKTAFIMFRPSKTIGKQYEVNIDGTLIKESESERVLGVQVQRNLQWNEHGSKIMKKINYGLSKLKQLRGLMRQKSLKIIAEGIVLSHIRYCIPVYLGGEVRMGNDEPHRALMSNLQKKVNDCMRIILGKRRSDRVTCETLLMKTGLKPVNHIAAESILYELWKAKHFRIDSISDAYSLNRVIRHASQRRTSKDPNSFVSKSAVLWNKMSEQFRSGTIKSSLAKREISNCVKLLPNF